MGRQKQWPERMVAAFEKGVIGGMDRARRRGETRTDFVRVAVEGELARRVAGRAQAVSVVIAPPATDNPPPPVVIPDELAQLLAGARRVGGTALSDLSAKIDKAIAAKTAGEALEAENRAAAQPPSLETVDEEGRIAARRAVGLPVEREKGEKPLAAKKTTSTISANPKAAAVTPQQAKHFANFVEDLSFENAMVKSFDEGMSPDDDDSAGADTRAGVVDRVNNFEPVDTPAPAPVITVVPAFKPAPPETIAAIAAFIEARTAGLLTDSDGNTIYRGRQPGRGNGGRLDLDGFCFDATGRQVAPPR